MSAANILAISSTPFLTDGGMETTLVFKEHRDLPAFAAFPLLFEREGREWLENYFRDYLEIASDHQAGFVFGTPTWRNNPAWVGQIGFSNDSIWEASERSVELGAILRSEFHSRVPKFLISGCVGPRGDGYLAHSRMTPNEAAEFHSIQIEAHRAAGIDFITATSLSHTTEAIGIARAAQSTGIPCVLSFTVETDGKLPSGESLEEAIGLVDSADDTDVTFFMINCAHPSHFSSLLSQNGAWVKRIRGIRANASSMSHAELDEAEELDEGDPDDLAQLYRSAHSHLDLKLVGGCCGTDKRHVQKIAEAIL